MTKTTAGTVVLSGSNVYTGLTSVQGGVLELNSAGNPAISGSLSITSGTVQLDRSNQISSSQGVGITSSVLALQNNSNTVAGVTLTSGSITGSGTLSSTSAFDVRTGTISASLGGGVGLNKTTSGTVVLSGSNVYTGLTSMQGGILELNSAGNPAISGSLSITSGTVQLDRSNQILSSQGVGITSSVLALQNNSNTVAGVSLLSGSITGSGTLSSTSAFDIQSGAISASLGGSAGLNKTTAGTVVLSGSNVYTGLTTVSGGILELNTSVNPAISGSLSITSGTVQLDQSNQILATQGVSVNGGVLALQNNNNTVAGVSLTSGSITGSGTLSSTSAFDVRSGTISANLGGGVGLNKTTAGTVLLVGSNVYTGLTTVSGGVLELNTAVNPAISGSVSIIGGTVQLDRSNQIASGQGVSVNGGVLALQSNSNTVAGLTLTGGSITGSGTLTSTTSFDVRAGAISASLGGNVGLTKSTGGTVLLSGSNVYTGLTSVQGGILELNTSGSPAISGSLSITGGTVQLDQSNQILATQGVGVAGGVLALQGNSNTVAGLTLAGGAVTGSNGILTSTSDFLVQSGSISASLGGNVGLNKTTGGTVVLSGSNFYTGLTSVSGPGGVLELNTTAGNAISGNLTVTSGTVQWDRSNQVVDSSIVTLNGGTLLLGANNDTIGQLLVVSGSIVGTGNLTTTSDYILESGTVAQSLGGLVGVQKTTSGTVLLTASNSYTGLTTVQDGILELNSSAGPSVSGNGLVINSGTVQLDQSNQIASGQGVTIQNGVLALQGNSNAVAGVSLINGAITGSNGTLTSASDFLVQSGSISATLGGAVGLTKTTGGTVILTGSNTYTGLTSVQAGRLELNSTGSPAISGSVQINGGTMQLDQSNQIASGQGIGVNGGVLALQTYDNTVAGVTLTSGSITGSGTVTSTTTFDVQSGAISASLGGSVGLTKTTGGKVVLSGSNVYTGLTLVQGGILELSATGSPAISGSLGITSGTVQLDRSNQIAASQGVGLNGGVLALQNNNNTVAGLTLTSGSITGSGTLTSTTDFAVQSGAISASLSGSVGLTKTTSGTVVLSNSNSYTGLTSVQGGILELNSAAGPAVSGSLGITSGTVQLDRSNQIAASQGVGLNGGVLALQNNSNTVAGLTLTSGSITGSGTLTSTTNFDVRSGAISASLSGSVGLTKTTSGTVILSGSNTYTGLTLVQGGILELNSAAGPAVSGSLSITSGTVQLDRSNQIASGQKVGVAGGVLALQGNSNTVGGVLLTSGSITGTAGGALTSTTPFDLQSGFVSANLSGSPAVVKSGSGTVTFAGANSYRGGTIVDGGLLQVTGQGTLGSTTGSLTVNPGATLDLGATTQTVGPMTITSGTVQGGTLIASSVTSNGGAIASVLAGPGGLTQSSGVLTLTGANTYTGPTVVNSGTLVLNTTGAPAIVGGITVNGGVARLNQNNQIGAASNVTIAGGTLDVQGYSDTVNSFHLASGAVTGNGTIYSTTGFVVDSGTISASLAGDGGLTKNTGGTVYLTGSNSYTGLTLINGGVLYAFNVPGPIVITAGQLFISGNAFAPAGSGVSSLPLIKVIGTGYSEIQSGAIAPFNYFVDTTVRNPNGDLRITAGAELWGGVQVKKGYLVVDVGGKLDGPLTLTGPHAEARIDGMLGDSRSRYHASYGASVGAGAYLHGNGKILGSVVNAGTVSAGNSPGKLTIGGNYTQLGSGTLLQDLASATSYDRLVVGGYAKLSGSVRVNYLNGFAPTVGQSFTILTAAGGVHGTLSLLDPRATGTLLSLGVVYKPTSVLLEYTQGSFAALDGKYHLTENQLAVAKNLDNLAARNPKNKLIGKLDTFQLGALPAQLEKLSPSGLAAIFEQGIATESIQSSNVQRRLQEIRNGASGFSASGANITDSHGSLSCDGLPLYGAADAADVKFTPTDKNAAGKTSIMTPGKDQRWGTFLAGSGEFTQIDGDSNAKGTDFTTGGVTLGLDYRLSDNFAAGLMAGYANTTTGKSANGSVDSNAGKAGVYATYYQDGLYFDGSFDFGSNSYDTKRSTIGGTARGSATGQNWNGLIGGGFDRKVGGFAYGPVASVQYTHIGIDQFSESGSLAPLTFPGQSQESLRTQAGFHVSYAMKLGTHMFLTPDVRIQWQHEFMDATSSIASRFAGGTNSFTVSGPALKRDSVWVDAGASLQVNPDFSVFTYFTGDFGRSNYSSNAVNGGVRINF